MAEVAPYLCSHAGNCDLHGSSLLFPAYANYYSLIIRLFPAYVNIILKKMGVQRIAAPPIFSYFRLFFFRSTRQMFRSTLPSIPLTVPLLEYCHIS